VFSHIGFFVGLVFFFAVTYVVDPIGDFTADVGIGTRIWRGGEFHSYSFGGCSRGVGFQFAARPQSCLAQ
jgi:hypothetical protein